MQFNEHILLFRNNLSPVEEQNIVNSVLNNKLQFNKVTLHSHFDLNSFGTCLKNEELLEQFWSTLGKTVTSIEVAAFWMFDKLRPYFPNIKIFHNNNLYVFDAISQEYVRKNLSDVETIILSTEMIEYKRLDEDIKVDDRLITILEHCGESLKIITFGCHIPLEMEIINEIFAKINFDILHMDEIIFECEPMPSCGDYQNFQWIIEQIQMIFEAGRLVINPLIIQDKIQPGQNICEAICPINHLTINSKSVVEFTFKNVFINGCHGYFKSCFESFSNLKLVTRIRNCNEEILDLMSRNLTLLEEIEVAFQTMFEHWPPFPNLRRFNITFQKTSKKHFEIFVKSYPQLSSLTVEIGTGLMADDLVRIVSENLKGLVFLSISCDESQITRVGLNLIRTAPNFKGLNHFRIQCSENRSEVKKLFHTLPNLEMMEVNAVQYYRSSLGLVLPRDNERVHVSIYALPKELRMKIQTFLNEIDQQSFVQALKVTINDLPSEILDLIFSYLGPAHSSIRCRLVCQFWFNILSSSTRCCRELKLENAFLSWDSSPVKLFVKTRFHYNVLVINQATVYDKSQSLSEFWKVVGRHITCIRMYCASPYTSNIFESGFQVQHLPHLKKLFLLNFTYTSQLPFETSPSWISILSTIKTMHISFYFGLEVQETIQSSFHFTNLEELKIDFYQNIPGRKWEVILEMLKLGTFPNLSRLIIFMGEKNNFSSIFLSTGVVFDRMTVLAVIRSDVWSNDDLELIWKSCPQLQIIGFGLYTFQLENDDFSEEDCEKIFQTMDCCTVVNVLFEKLGFLSDVGFVMFCFGDHGRTNKQKVFTRSGIRSFKESHKSFRFFDYLKERCY